MPTDKVRYPPISWTFTNKPGDVPDLLKQFEYVNEKEELIDWRAIARDAFDERITLVRWGWEPNDERTLKVFKFILKLNKDGKKVLYETLWNLGLEHRSATSVTNGGPHQPLARRRRAKRK